MFNNRLARKVFGSTFLLTMLVPAFATAAEAASTEPFDWRVSVTKAASAGAAMSISAMSAGYAQAKIGTAAAGTLAERPEVSVWAITLQVLPEVIVLLGFVSAIIIAG